MFDRIVMGVDPGIASTGLAAVGTSRREGLRVAWSHTVRTAAGADEATRLELVHAALAEALGEWGPEALAVERLMWGRNVGSAMSVARASGVVLLAGAQARVPVHEYAPLEVKMAITGSGVARKEDLRRALARLLSVRGVPSQPDAADAVAVAVCHLAQAPAVRGRRVAT
ncbi:MAG: crossover junction endodeoxyribonuclease RuvC [Actinomycetota bacterium]|nr:crossover junction endodeoxyribonuclease RuvC [Actinomycetota bacterium]